MSGPNDSTVTIRATGSGPRFLALLEAAARIDGASIHCGGAQPRSVEAAQAELDAALAPRRAEAAAAMRERTPAVAATLAALRWGGTAQAAAEPELKWDAERAWAAFQDYVGSSHVLARACGLNHARLELLLTSGEQPTPDEVRAIYEALGLGGAQ